MNDTIRGLPNGDFEVLRLPAIDPSMLEPGGAAPRKVGMHPALGMGYGTTAGVKFDGDKPRLDLLDPHAIEQLALVLGFGAKKYAEHNWRKGLSKTRLLAAALRHLFAYLRGEDRDAETGLPHPAHAMCCCMFLLGLAHRPELDDRWKEGAK